MKSILPTLKTKKRYLAFEIISKRKIKDFSSISQAIWTNSFSFLGELGVANMGLLLLADKWQDESQKGIIKVNHTQVNNLKTMLSLIKKINKQDVIIRSIGVSGILKKAEEKYMAS